MRLISVNVILCLPILCLAINRPTSIKLENNEYTGMVIGIHPDIPEDPALLTRIQEMVTSASEYLYTATRQRAYFKNVTIVLPETWTNSDLYESPGNASFEYADVIIAPSNPRFAPTPYTKHFEACGKQAAYIHYTSAFLMDSKSELYYGPLGPLFVHEWGHFRWGILNEYADTVADRSSYEYHYRSPTNGLYEATRCPIGLNGLHLKLDTTSYRYTYCSGNSGNGYEEGCVFIPTADQDPEEVSASIMFGYTSLPLIIDFCDNDTADAKTYHNVEAPNKLNRICGLKSSWEIMREHSDFKDDNNPPRAVSDRRPTFRITRVLPRRVVVVMDTSISMLNDGRHLKQASAIAHYISTTVMNATTFGLVSFSTEARIDSEMRVIVSDDDRQELLNDINQNEPSGGTCIQCGLEEALKIINNGTSDGAIILLITDGDETVGDLMEALSDIVSANVVVDAVAFSEDADAKLSYLSSQTGGTLYLQTDDIGSAGIYQGLGGTMKRGVIESQQRVELESTSYLLQTSGNLTDQVSVDGTIGERTSFFFSWNKNTGNVLVKVTVTSPSGIEYDDQSDEYMENIAFRYVIFNIQGPAEVGTWTYSVTNLYSNSIEVTIDIASYPLQNDEIDPIVVTSYLSGSTSDAANGDELVAFAEVRQGYNPIVDANVVAIIERPPDGQGNYYEPVQLHLLDNGAGADLTEGDGIYSRYFTEYSNNGFYGVKILVDNNNGQAIILRQTTVPFEAAQLIIDPDNLENPVIPEIGGIQARLPGMPPPELEGVKAPEFSRKGNGQSVAVSELPEDYDPTVDSTPPSAILNLRVLTTSYKDGRLTMDWTAPGDDLDSGKASRYDIRRADTIQELFGDFESGILVESSDVIDGNLTDPQEFGMKETIIISLPIQSDLTSYSYAVAIKSIDDMEQFSKISNVVIATFEKDVLPTSGPVEPPAPGLEWWMIAFIVVACLLFLILIYLGLAKFRLSKKKEKILLAEQEYNNDKERLG